MLVALWVGVLGLLTGFGLIWWTLTEVSNRLLTAIETVGHVLGHGIEVSAATAQRESSDDLRPRILELEDAIDRLPAKWEDFEQAVMRRENRVRQVVTRARERLEEHGFEDAGVEAEAAELRLVDGAGSEDGGVSPVRGEVATHATPSLPTEPWEGFHELTRRKYGLV